MWRARVIRTAAALALLAASAVMGVSAASPVGAAACPTVFWGSLPEQVMTLSPVHVRGARAGINTCFDRLVIDLDSQPAPGWTVAYGPVVATSGATVPLAGGASLRVTVNSPAYDDAGAGTITEPLPGVSGFPVFRDLRYVESFEGYTTYGLGVRARLPFRVFALPGPGAGSRVVIDVYRNW